jgi:hypothetical protein
MRSACEGSQLANVSGGKKDNKWRTKIQEWMEGLAEKNLEQHIKHEKSRIEGRKRAERPSDLEVTVLSNKPTNEEYEWEEFRIEVQPDDQLKEIVQEVRNRWGEIWKEEDLVSASLWGREGELDWEEKRSWVDGERFILIAQPKEGRPDIEGRSRLGQEEAKVNNFFSATEWRREISLRWQEDHPDWKKEW